MKHRKYILIIIFCCLAFFAKAQNIENLISQTEEYLSVYDILSPWVEYYSLKDFSFSEEELKDIDLENDSIEGYNIISIFQNRILDNIDKIAHHKDFPQKGSDLFLAAPDNKLFNFTLFENTGGSYKSFISIIYYKENNDLVYYEYSNGENTNNPVFAPDGYFSIDTIQTNSGVKYLLQGCVITCMTCCSQYITLIQFENDHPVCEFSYQLNTRGAGLSAVLTDWNPDWEWLEKNIIYYNDTTKIITIEYATDDLTHDCFCEQECNNDTYRGESGDEYPVIHRNCHCVFAFNGETFELIEQCWQKRKE
jgi:hypothetical protein